MLKEELSENNLWDDGLSPKPLYSFFHKKNQTRHWSKWPDGCGFICPTARSLEHYKGGDPRMDLHKGICMKCIDTVQTMHWVDWKDYFKA